MLCTSFRVLTDEYRSGFTDAEVEYGCERMPALSSTTYWPMTKSGTLESVLWSQLRDCMSVARIGSERERNALSESIGPALAKTASLGGLEATASAATSKAVGETVSILVNNDVVLEGTIAVGAGESPGEHTHLTRLAVGRGGKVGVVGSRRVLDGDEDMVVLSATLAVVVALEVVCSLGEA